jgi:hypothetical protein
MRLKQFLNEKISYWEKEGYKVGVYPRHEKAIAHAQKRFDSFQQRSGGDVDKFEKMLTLRISKMRDIEKLRAFSEVLTSWNFHELSKEAKRKYLKLGGPNF